MWGSYVGEGRGRGVYRREGKVLGEGGRRIWVGDTGEFLYREVVRGEYVGKGVGVGY